MDKRVETTDKRSTLAESAGAGPWVRLSRWLIMSPVVWVVALADLGGAIAGYSYWYGSTILESPWYYWIFVPDCPLAATLMGVALLAYHFGRRWDLLGVVAAAVSIKYGLWTVVSWVTEFSRGGPLSLEGTSMALAHFVLLAQGLLLLGLLSYRLLSVVSASLFLVGNDLADYVADQYPRLPERVDVGPMMILAVVTTAVIIVFLVSMTWRSARRGRVAPHNA